MIDVVAMHCGTNDITNDSVTETKMRKMIDEVYVINRDDSKLEI